MVQTDEVSRIEWRLGEQPGDTDAWYAAPATVHVYLDLRTPETPPGQWHRVWAVTRSWVEANVLTASGAIVPPLVVVADGSPEELLERLDHLAQTGWRLIVRSATLLPADYKPVEW